MRNSIAARRGYELGSAHYALARLDVGRPGSVATLLVDVYAVDVPRLPRGRRVTRPAAGEPPGRQLHRVPRPRGSSDDTCIFVHVLERVVLPRPGQWSSPGSPRHAAYRAQPSFREIPRR